MGEPDVERRQMSFEEAMSIAILFQKHGHLEEAEGVYRQILDQMPEHPDVLHFTGVLAHQQGRSEEAISLIEKSLTLRPDQPDCYSNLGIIFKAMGRIDEAAQAYEKAIALNPHHVNAYSNLGVLRKAQKRPVEAEAAYREALRLNPSHIETHHNLGILLAGLGRTKEAVECYCRVTTLSPNHPEARRLLAMAHCTLGEVDKAVEIFRTWLKDEPDNPVPRHMLAACSGQGVPARAADAYVEKVFDDFAGSFDQKLASLDYRAPVIVGAMLADAILEPAGKLDVLDAGCGTGLCGPLIAQFAKRLTGVDLSAGMLAKAQEKNVYDELVKAELTGFLRSHPAEFDVIVSADTLVYFGRLDDVLIAAEKALRPGGVLIFTLEEETRGGADFLIGTHGRYTHAPAYVGRLLTGAGLRTEILEAELRMEAGTPVAGLAVRATKTAGDAHG